MAAWKALLAQIIGWAILLPVLAVYPALSESALPLALVQGGLAALASRLLHAAAWWLPIHLLFSAAAVLAGRLGLPPGLYLAAFVLLLLIYGRTFRGEVPLFLTNRATARALADLLPPQAGSRVADLGAGTGSALAALAAARPDARFCGIEYAPLPYLAARLACAKYGNCEVRREDFWRHPLDAYDAVYAFLSPAVMPRLWAKAKAEMRPGSLLVSSSFPVPGIAPERTVEVADARRTRLYCYRI